MRAIIFRGLVLAVVLAASPSFGAAARRTPPPPPSPETAATAFYAAYVRLHPSGIPGARDRTRLRASVSEHLYTLLQEADRAEARYAVLTKHEAPPLIEGDVFSSLFEGATSFRLGACMTDGDVMARCAVDLTYKSDGQPDTTWTDTVTLLHEGRRYRVDDVIYGGTWPFANKGRLTDVLNDAIAESQKPAD